MRSQSEKEIYGSDQPFFVSTQFFPDKRRHIFQFDLINVSVIKTVTCVKYQHFIL